MSLIYAESRTLISAENDTVDPFAPSLEEGTSTTLKNQQSVSELVSEASFHNLVGGGLTYPFNEPEVVNKLFGIAHLAYNRAEAYDLVVGEDTSGRLPALLMRKVINKRRAELDLPQVAMRFLSGRASEEVPEDFIPPASSPEGRALVVTEYIFTGGSVLNVYNAIANIRGEQSVDIATVGGQIGGIERVASAIRPSMLLANKDASKIDGHLYHNSEITDAKGVSKRRGPCFSERQEEYHYKSEAVKKSRADIETLAYAFAVVCSK